ncbi:MAG: orotate phosphoribosyltransferase [Clostridiales bacterium]|nr:orotate phosphoribosyltransferase [Clostridiales bacterium]
MEKSRAEDILKQSDALLIGHFLLTSGRHSDRYIQCAKVLQRPEFTSELMQSLAKEFESDGIGIVIGPAMGGIIIAYEAARHLGAKSLFAERENGRMALRRGFSISRGASVLVAEDVVTTGGTVREVMELVRASGGNVAGVCALVDRSMGAVDFGVKFAAAYTADVKSWDAADCPLCKEGVPAVKPGSRNIARGL